MSPNTFYVFSKTVLVKRPKAPEMMAPKRPDTTKLLTEYLALSCRYRHTVYRLDASEAAEYQPDTLSPSDFSGLTSRTKTRIIIIIKLPLFSLIREHTSSPMPWLILSFN